MEKAFQKPVYFYFHLFCRYNTYTVKLSPSKMPLKNINNENKKNTVIKERRTTEKERFKTRTLSKGEFEEMAKGQESNKSPRSPQSPCDDSCNVSSDAEGYAEQSKAKIVKPVTRAKSGIPIVRSKLPTSKSKFTNNPTKAIIEIRFSFELLF